MKARLDHVFTLNMVIYKLKYSMELLMNVDASLCGPRGAWCWSDGSQ